MLGVRVQRRASVSLRVRAVTSFGCALQTDRAMDNNPGVAVAVPCLVLSSSGISLSVKDKEASEASSTVVSLDGQLGPNTPLVVLNSETGEVTPVSLLNTLAGESTALGTSGTAFDDEGGKGTRIAFVRTDTGETTPIIIGAGLVGDPDVSLQDAVARPGDFGSGDFAEQECRTRTAVQQERIAYTSCGGRTQSVEDSQKLAEYDETLTMLMQPENGTIDCSVSENTNQNGNCSARKAGTEHAREAGSIEHGKTSPGGSPQKPAAMLPETRYILNKVISCSDGHGTVEICSPGSGCGPTVEPCTEEWQRERRSLDVHCEGAARQNAVNGPSSERCSRLEVLQAQHSAQGFNCEHCDGEQVVSMLALNAEQSLKADGDEAVVGVPCQVSSPRIKKQHQQQQQQAVCDSSFRFCCAAMVDRGVWDWVDSCLCSSCVNSSRLKTV